MELICYVCASITQNEHIPSFFDWQGVCYRFNVMSYGTLTSTTLASQECIIAIRGKHKFLKQIIGNANNIDAPNTNINYFAGVGTRLFYMPENRCY